METVKTGTVNTDNDYGFNDYDYIDYEYIDNVVLINKIKEHCDCIKSLYNQLDNVGRENADLIIKNKLFNM